MKIPTKCTTKQKTDFANDYFASARRLSVEYGVYIDVKGEYKDGIVEFANMEHIFYKVKIDGVYREFEGTAPLIAALKKTIENKEQI